MKKLLILTLLLTSLPSFAEGKYDPMSTYNASNALARCVFENEKVASCRVELTVALAMVVEDEVEEIIRKALLLPNIEQNRAISEVDSELVQSFIDYFDDLRIQEKSEAFRARVQ
jgi:hypothetical protein